MDGPSGSPAGDHGPEIATLPRDAPGSAWEDPIRVPGIRPPQAGSRPADEQTRPAGGPGRRRGAVVHAGPAAASRFTKTCLASPGP